jgi:hypothetical protein
VLNKQDEKKMKIYDNVKMLGTDLDTKYFTRHGQHFNSSGKELISMKLAMVIKEFFLLMNNYPLFACNGKILSLKDSKGVHQNQK